MSRWTLVVHDDKWEPQLHMDGIAPDLSHLENYRNSRLCSCVIVLWISALYHFRLVTKLCMSALALCTSLERKCSNFICSFCIDRCLQEFFFFLLAFCIVHRLLLRSLPGWVKCDFGWLHLEDWSSNIFDAPSWCKVVWGKADYIAEKSRRDPLARHAVAM